MGLANLLALLLNGRSPDHAVAALVAQTIVCLPVTTVMLMTAWCVIIFSKRCAGGDRVCDTRATAAPAITFMGAMITGETVLFGGPAGFAILKLVRRT